MTLVLPRPRRVLVDLLADRLESAILQFEMILLQLGLDVLDEQLVFLAVELLLELSALVVVDHRDQHLVHEAQVVVTHQYVVRLENSLSKWLQKRVISSLLLEFFKGL